MPISFSQWMMNTPYGAITGPQPQVEPVFRDALDRMRSAYRRTPEAEYPDGYLGTIRSRRDDKTYEAVQNRLNQRSYQRGIHKGERIDPGDYVWPSSMSPMSGLQREAQAIDGRYMARAAPIGTFNEKLVTEGKMPIPRGAGGVMTLIDPKRQEQLRRLAPSWNP
jgi:hypothetical protein